MIIEVDLHTDQRPPMTFDDSLLLVIDADLGDGSGGVVGVVPSNPPPKPRSQALEAELSPPE